MLLVWLVVAAFLYWPIKVIHITYELRVFPPFISALLWPLFFALIGWMIINEKFFQKKKTYSNDDVPSWVTDKQKQKEFIAVIYMLGAKSQIPHEFIKENITNDENFSRYLKLSKNLADRGFPITAQAETVFYLIEEDFRKESEFVKISDVMKIALERQKQQQQVEKLREHGIKVNPDF